MEFIFVSPWRENSNQFKNSWNGTEQIRSDNFKVQEIVKIQEFRWNYYFQDSDSE